MKSILHLSILASLLIGCSKNTPNDGSAVDGDNNVIVVEEQSIVLEAPVNGAFSPGVVINDDYSTDQGDAFFAGDSTGFSYDSVNQRIISHYSSGTLGTPYLVYLIDTVPGQEYTVSMDIEQIGNDNITNFGGYNLFVRDGDASSISISMDATNFTQIPGATTDGTGNNVAPGTTDTLQITFTAISTTSSVISGHGADLAIFSINSVSINGAIFDPENSNEVIDMGVLSRVGQTIKKRVYVQNKTGADRTIDDSQLVGTGLSVEANTCSTLANEGLCYIDLAYTLSSDSQSALGTIIADISDDPANATPEWGRLSIIGALGAEIDNGLVSPSDVSLSESVVSFGNLKEGSGVIRRVYISNSSSNDLNNLVPAVDSPFTIERNGCASVLKGKRLCSVDIKLSYDAGVVASGKLSLSADNIDLSAVETDLNGSSVAADTDNQFAALDGSGSPVDLTVEGADADYSDIGVGNSRSVRIYFSNQNNDYDFGSPSSVGVLGDVVVDRTSCEGLVKEGSVCYVDVTYTRQLIPATDTKLSIAPGLEYEFALPGGVFDESYFDSAVFQ